MWANYFRELFIPWLSNFCLGIFNLNYQWFLSTYQPLAKSVTSQREIAVALPTGRDSARLAIFRD
jgi:hypothetical protein